MASNSLLHAMATSNRVFQYLRSRDNRAVGAAQRSRREYVIGTCLRVTVAFGVWGLKNTCRPLILACHLQAVALGAISAAVGKAISGAMQVLPHHDDG